MSRILVVDDQEQVCIVLTEILSKQCHEVQTATTGEEAVDALQMFSPDLVLLDLLMPGMDGMSVLAEVRRWNADIPVVILSGVEDDDTAEKAIFAGAVDYITKPILSDQLNTVLEVHLFLHES